jgi:hypothetical protein
MDRYRRLNFLVLVFSGFGVAAVIGAVVLMFVNRESGSGMSVSTLLVGLGVIMQGVAAVGSIVSNILKAQSDRIEALERRFQEAGGVPYDGIRR